MENVLPKCKCGADVHVEIYYLPRYDDGGGLECMDVEELFWGLCYDCWVICKSPSSDKSDELPF